ncbi:MAG: hypothetical protein KatS3mg109_1296 [Pirellulaceae bacterium]|nr:MAG: hypothetical protein KatS3mg109_1296 [Pirellulaceae bacterium]
MCETMRMTGRRGSAVDSGDVRWYRCFLVAVVGVALVAGLGRGYRLLVEPLEGLEQAAVRFVDSLDENQRNVALLPFDSPQRVDWHFIPKNQRKGLQIRDMNSKQREAALALLRICLSQVGYQKATKIMELEKVLHELESSRQGGPLRDPERYYFTLFGRPGQGRWGLSVEGHHLSLNFVIEHGRVISSTPSVFAANPAEMKAEVAGVPRGLRLLADEEQLAFELLASLSEQQKARAIISREPLREVRAAGQPQPPRTPPEGIPASELTETQRERLRKLVSVYAGNLADPIAADRLEAIERAGWEKVHFAWAGATQPGSGHYYRVQGPTFLIEFVNTQPDAAGNPANHIHSVWRDMRGDFALPIGE